MNLKQAKNFMRKISDYMQERKNEDCGVSKANPQIYGKDKYIQGLDMIEVHEIIDETLEKIRSKIIDKALEAENTLKEFEKKLAEGRSSFENVKRQLQGIDENELKQL